MRRIVALAFIMRNFRISVGVAPLSSPRNIRLIEGVIVDPCAQLSWLPDQVLEELGIERQKRSQFGLVNGELILRDVGYACLHANGSATVDEVVFAAPHDPLTLGARTLAGLNLCVDVHGGFFVDAGPIPA
jgi:hypothetical protein